MDQSYTDKDIIASVNAYRQVESNDKWGPPTLSALSKFMKNWLGLHVAPARSNLSGHLHEIILAGHLSAIPGAGNHRYCICSLQVTDTGYQVVDWGDYLPFSGRLTGGEYEYEP